MDERLSLVMLIGATRRSRTARPGGDRRILWAPAFLPAASPTINAGALVTTDRVRGVDSAEKLDEILGSPRVYSGSRSRLPNTNDASDAGAAVGLRVGPCGQAAAP
jgi:hypothetical protein